MISGFQYGFLHFYFLACKLYALAKNEVFCKKKSEINAKEISYPIQTFQVIDLSKNLEKDRKVVDKRINRFVELVQNENLSSFDKDYITEKIAKRL